MNKKVIYLVIVAVAVIGAVLFFLQGGRLTPLAPQVQAPPVATPLSNGPAIVKAVVSRSIDAKGNATGETTTFNSKTDKIVYAVLTLQNVKKTTKLSYTRYLNSKYVDSKVAEPSKGGITTFHFSFEKGIGDYPKGNYTLNLYLDGKKVTTINYVFQ